jgi:general secretion pathway protein G
MTHDGGQIGTLTGVRRRRARGWRAFTLLEMLLVMVILGLLAAIIIVRASATRQYAEEKVSDHTLSSLDSAIEQYKIENTTWPTTLDDLVPTYLPDGVPQPVVNGATYGIDPVTHRATITLP